MTEKLAVMITRWIRTPSTSRRKSICSLRRMWHFRSWLESLKFSSMASLASLRMDFIAQCDLNQIQDSRSCIPVLLCSYKDQCPGTSRGHEQIWTRTSGSTWWTCRTLCSGSSRGWFPVWSLWGWWDIWSIATIVRHVTTCIVCFRTSPPPRIPLSW